MIRQVIARAAGADKRAHREPGFDQPMHDRRSDEPARPGHENCCRFSHLYELRPVASRREMPPAPRVPLPTGERRRPAIRPFLYIIVISLIYGEGSRVDAPSRGLRGGAEARGVGFERADQAQTGGWASDTIHSRNLPCKDMIPSRRECFPNASAKNFP